VTSIRERLENRSGRTVDASGKVRQIVLETDELRRVRDLPWRDWRVKDIDELVEGLTELLKTPTGTQTLRPVQAAALAELHDLGGLFAPIAVGEGKTAISALAAHVCDAKRALLLVPASLIEKTYKDFGALARHWKVWPITVQSYEMLSRDRTGKILQGLRPDLIIADEAHRLKNMSAGCTKRISRYLRDVRKHGEYHCRFVAMSGTITTRSLKEYWHLINWCLGANAPLPNEMEEFWEWCAALDEKVSPDKRYAPGKLLTLAPDPQGADVLARARDAYGRRLTASPGVISSMGARPPMALNLKATHLEAPPKLREMITEMRRSGCTPDGIPFEMPTELWRHAREMQCGFWYMPVPYPPFDWLCVRKDWSKFQREVLKRAQIYATPGDIIRAVQHPELLASKPEWLEEGTELWNAWQAVKPSYKRVTEPQWLDDTAIKYAAEWLHTGDTSSKLCWVEHRAVGPALEKAIGVPYFGSGALNSSGTYLENHDGPAIVSVRACSTGLNLQYKWYQNLYLSPMGKNDAWEQSLGRTHRQGQPQDEVTAEVLMMCREAYSSMVWAIREAQYAEPTNGPQKLQYCTRDLGEIESLISRRNDTMWMDELQGI